MPKPDAKPKLRTAPSRAALDAQQQEAEERLRTLETWTEDAAVRAAPKPARASRKTAPAPKAEDPKAKLRATLYAIPIEQEHTLFVRIPQRLFKMLEEVEHERRHSSMKELVQLALTDLVERALDITLYKSDEPPGRPKF